MKPYLYPGINIPTIFQFIFFLILSSCNTFSDSKKTTTDSISLVPSKPVIDSSDYAKRMDKMANGDTTGKWKFSGLYPKVGAILPFKRVIAYYGNFYSTKMGILGELPKNQMFARLKQEVNAWQKADTSTPVIPALHYIVTTAQGSPGSSGNID
jgi:hypothetical protein